MELYYKKQNQQNENRNAENCAKKKEMGKNCTHEHGMSDQAIEHRRFSRALHKLNYQAPAGAQGSERVACDWDGGPEGVRTTLPMATTVRKDDPRRLGRSSAEGSSSASSAVPCRVVSASSASSSIASIGPGIQADRRSRVWRRQGMEAVISGVGLLPNGARCGGSASSCVPDRVLFRVMETWEQDTYEW